MTILKSEQILADSAMSFEDAIATAVGRFAKTVRNVRSANVNNLSVTVENGKITDYRVNLQVTFEVDEPASAKTSAASAKKATRK